MVVDIAVGGEQEPVAGSVDAKRVLFFAIVHRRDEDAGRVKLVRAEFGHQAATGPVPKPPSDELFHRGAIVEDLVARLYFCAIVAPPRKIAGDCGVFQLHLFLGDFLLPKLNLGRASLRLFERIKLAGPSL